MSASTVNELPQARQSMGGQKEYAPLLVLPDMRMLVLPQQAKLYLFDTQNDMVKRLSANAQCVGDETPY